MGVEEFLGTHETVIVAGNNLLGEGIFIGPYSMIRDIKLGNDSKLFNHVNAYGCEIGARVKVGGFVEITSGVKIGDDVTVSSHSFVCTGVTIDDGAWLGHGVKTINDLYPPSKKRTGSSQYWRPTYIGKQVIVGTGAVLFPVRIGDMAIIGAGAVVRKDVPAGEVWAGNPAKYICNRHDLKYDDINFVFPRE